MIALTSFFAGFVVALICIGVALCLLAFLWLNRVEETPADTRPPFVLRFWLGDQFIQGEHLMSRITTEGRRRITVVARTAAGNPAQIDGDVQYSSSDESVARIDIVEGAAYVVAVAPGASQILAVFDAQMDEGVRLIELSGAIEVVPAEATRGEIVFGDEELIPTPSQPEPGE